MIGKEFSEAVDQQSSKLNAVLFSGGRGSQVLSKDLIGNPRVNLTIAINGYDDGASTGEVRRFLKDSLGPSDFRKNASRMARALQSCSSSLIDLLDMRFPEGSSLEDAARIFQHIRKGVSNCGGEFHQKVAECVGGMNPDTGKRLSVILKNFEDEVEKSRYAFSFSDCSIGNLVFAGCYLGVERHFNQAIGEYCDLLNLPGGLIENVTDGTNAFLVALDQYNQVLWSEAEIVDASRRNYIKEIFLIDRLPTETERKDLRDASLEELNRYFKEHEGKIPLNPTLLGRIEAADLIIYAPGTQHSSLLPSYMTPGLGMAIAKNLTALKVLMTNIQEDAEIPESSAVDIITKAVYYLKEKGRQRIPTPCLITHFLVNDHERPESEEAYVPLGRLQNFEDPRMVRIENFEEGLTGHHDAQKILGPFVESLLKKYDSARIAILLLDTESLNKVVQTILEALRAGIGEVQAIITIFYRSAETWDMTSRERTLFRIHNVWTPGEDEAESFLRAVKNQRFDFVLLFESSGMYKGDDIVNLLSLLSSSRLDAVWGSRRLSVKDIRESYKLRYRHKPLVGAISYVGSHLLSLAYLILYGRYISDTLSGVRAVKTAYLNVEGINLKDKGLNHHLLSRILREQGEIFETPIQFFPLSPEAVKRTTIWDGVLSVLSILWWRFRRQKP